VDDRPHLIPGFDRYEDEDTAEVAGPDPDAERTQILPVSGAESAEETQVIPTDVPPDAAGKSTGRGTGRSRSRRRR
jgi:hypothetical protein